MLHVWYVVNCSRYINCHKHGYELDCAIEEVEIGSNVLRVASSTGSSISRDEFNLQTRTKCQKKCMH